MIAYIVTARPGSSNSDRYIDSLWITKQRADARAFALKAEFDRSGKDTANSWRAWVTECVIEDAALEPAKKKVSKDTPLHPLIGDRKKPKK